MTTPSVPVKGTKAVVAGIGATATAVLTWVTAVSVATGDDAVDLNEVAGLVSATLALVVTVAGVWKVTNRPKDVATERF